MRKFNRNQFGPTELIQPTAGRHPDVFLSVFEDGATEIVEQSVPLRIALKRILPGFAVDRQLVGKWRPQQTISNGCDPQRSIVGEGYPQRFSDNERVLRREAAIWSGYLANPPSNACHPNRAVRGFGDVDILRDRGVSRLELALPCGTIQKSCSGIRPQGASMIDKDRLWIARGMVIVRPFVNPIGSFQALASVIGRRPHGSVW